MLVVRSAIPLLLLLASGCWLAHDPDSVGPADPTVEDAQESTPDAGAPLERADAGQVETDAGPEDGGEIAVETTPENPCSVGAPCVEDAVTCDLSPIDGIPCCAEVRWCVEGIMERFVTCDDVCAQSCELIGERDDCTAFGCVWFVGGCADERDPDAYYGPGCIPPPGDFCETDEECVLGEVCQKYVIDPCSGQEECDVCAAEERRCTRPLSIP